MPLHLTFTPPDEPEDPSCPVWNSNTTLETLKSLIGKRVMINHSAFHAESELIEAKHTPERFGVFVASNADVAGIFFTPEQVESITPHPTFSRIRLCKL